MKIRNLFKGDLVIWVIYFFLCMVSLVEVFSAASTLTYKSGSFWDPLIKQAIFLGVGTVIVIVIHNIPCRFFKILPLLLIPISIFLLLWVLLFGGSINGAERWISWGFLQFQPSEIAKGAVVVAVALILARMQREEGADRQAFKNILLVAGVICLLIASQNLSTALLLAGVVYLMMIIGRVPGVLMAKLTGLAAVIIVALSSLILLSPNDSFVFRQPGMGRALTWKNRLLNHGNEGERNAKDYEVTDKNAQRDHANIAIATSNIIGRGPGNSVQRDFLSQAYSDFIYAIIIEEMGLPGAVAVLLLYIVLLVRAGRIASRCERNFPAFLVMGLALLLVTQALLNMMVATGLFPVTGQPLPLISRGGTSTIITCVYVGMILSVSRYARRAKVASDPFAPGRKGRAAVQQVQAEPDRLGPLV
ncbi:MAG: FtsW/RodA/SpoVE family cell cycle protein [Alloprevotella sp.]|nr:FtsW/RodA/SpoVE family cell cycle protein [Alloprevotella sp.]